MLFNKNNIYPNPEGAELILQKPSACPNEYQLEQIKRGYGMFIHFGINTFNNTEWSNGRLPVKSYRPTAINARQWVQTAYRAGMNYVILITKHHDGFCLWDTDTTKYSVKYSPVGIDVVRAVADACAEFGIKLGLYYSLWDRHELSYKLAFDRGYVPYMLRQLTELMDGRYGEIVELWLDGAWDKQCPKWRLDLIYDTVKRLQPKCQIGVNHTIGEYNPSRRGKSRNPADRYMPQNYRQGDPIRMFPSDFRLWDPHMCRDDDPKLYTFNNEQYYMPFEMTICSRDGFHWFYSDEYESFPPIKAEQIAEYYRRLTACRNIMVVNLPPNKNGELCKSDVDNIIRAAQLMGIERK